MKKLQGAKLFSDFMFCLHIKFGAALAKNKTLQVKIQPLSRQVFHPCNMQKLYQIWYEDRIRLNDFSVSNFYALPAVSS